MITRLDIEERTREWNLREDVVEKDYVLGWALWGIGSDPLLSGTWVFKGGTSLKKCFFETYRFSEDLDFTILPGGPILEADVRPILTAVLDRIAAESGIDFSRRAPAFKSHDSGTYTEGRIYYIGPRATPSVASIKLDLSSSERVVRTPAARPISHSFPDTLPEPATVQCYAFEEVFAEKIRAMGERCRPRDLYDIVYIFRRGDFHDQPEVVRDVLRQKCESKGISVPTFRSIGESSARKELESEWENMLGHQLPALPPFESHWEELENLFAWLEESAAIPIPVQAISHEGTALSDSQWIPQPPRPGRGVYVPFEAIRFAGSNRLCIEFLYNDGHTRVVEPYSLRTTQDGNLILHAVRNDTGESRSYRVDRIQSVKVTDKPFTPKYAVEFSSFGPIVAPSTPSRSVTPRAGRSPRRPSSAIRYTYQCPYCLKRFRRTKPNARLNKHKDKSGYPCPGRSGYLV